LGLHDAGDNGRRLLAFTCNNSPTRVPQPSCQGGAGDAVIGADFALQYRDLKPVGNGQRIHLIVIFFERGFENVAGRRQDLTVGCADG